MKEKVAVIDNSLVRQLADMIYRKNLMIADDLGLVLTEQDLDRLERAIVARWIKRALTEPFMPTIVCSVAEEEHEPS